VGRCFVLIHVEGSRKAHGRGYFAETHITSVVDEEAEQAAQQENSERDSKVMRVMPT